MYALGVVAVENAVLVRGTCCAVCSVVLFCRCDVLSCSVMLCSVLSCSVLTAVRGRRGRDVVTPGQRDAVTPPYSERMSSMSELGVCS